MKKLLILLLITVFSFSVYAQKKDIIQKHEKQVFFIVEDMPEFKGENGKILDIG